MTPSRVLILGDSISLGATEVFGADVLSAAPTNFVDKLRRLAPTRTIEVDAAVRRTTTDAVGRLPALLELHRPEVVVLVLGGNDADVEWKRFIVSSGRRLQHNVPVDTFEANLRKLVDASRAAGAVPFLCDLPSMDLAGRGRWLSERSKTDVNAMIDASGGEAESIRRLGLYNAAVNRVADATTTTVLHWARELASLPHADRFGPDALHPGDAAHPIIARVIGDALARFDADRFTSTPVARSVSA